MPDTLFFSPYLCAKSRVLLTNLLAEDLFTLNEFSKTKFTLMIFNSSPLEISLISLTFLVLILYFNFKN